MIRTEKRSLDEIKNNSVVSELHPHMGGVDAGAALKMAHLFDLGKKTSHVT